MKTPHFVAGAEEKNLPYITDYLAIWHSYFKAEFREKFSLKNAFSAYLLARIEWVTRFDSRTTFPITCGKRFIDCAPWYTMYSPPKFTS